MYLWLVAAGLSLIFGVMRVLNFAHGSLYMLGAYFAWVAFRISGSFWVALVAGPLLVAAAGWVLEFGFLRRVYSAPEAFQLLLTFAFVLIVRATAADREMARALGVRSSRLFTGVFVLGAWLAGLGGALSMPVRAI